MLLLCVEDVVWIAGVDLLKAVLRTQLDHTSFVSFAVKIGFMSELAFAAASLVTHPKILFIVKHPFRM